MTVNVPKELEQYTQQGVASGRFAPFVVPSSYSSVRSGQKFPEQRNDRVVNGEARFK